MISYFSRFKYSIIAFWLAMVALIMPYFFADFLGKPCFLCLCDRAILIFFALSIFLGKWYEFFKKIARFLSILLVAMALYHFLIILHIIPGPSVCSLNPGFELGRCDNSNPIVVFSVIILGLCLSALSFAA